MNTQPTVRSNTHTGSDLMNGPQVIDRELTERPGRGGKTVRVVVWRGWEGNNERGIIALNKQASWLTRGTKNYTLL